MPVQFSNEDDSLARALIENRASQQKARATAMQDRSQEDRAIVEKTLPLLQQMGGDPRAASILQGPGSQRLRQAYTNVGLGGIFQIDQQGRPFVNLPRPQLNKTQLQAQTIQNLAGQQARGQVDPVTQNTFNLLQQSSRAEADPFLGAQRLQNLESDVMLQMFDQGAFDPDVLDRAQRGDQAAIAQLQADRAELQRRVQELLQRVTRARSAIGGAIQQGP